MWKFIQPTDICRTAVAFTHQRQHCAVASTCKPLQSAAAATVTTALASYPNHGSKLEPYGHLLRRTSRCTAATCATAHLPMPVDATHAVHVNCFGTCRNEPRWYVEVHPAHRYLPDCCGVHSPTPALRSSQHVQAIAECCCRHCHHCPPLPLPQPSPTPKGASPGLTLHHGRVPAVNGLQRVPRHMPQRPPAEPPLCTPAAHKSLLPALGVRTPSTAHSLGPRRPHQ